MGLWVQGHNSYLESQVDLRGSVLVAPVHLADQVDPQTLANHPSLDTHQPQLPRGFHTSRLNIYTDDVHADGDILTPLSAVHPILLVLLIS